MGIDERHGDTAAGQTRPAAAVQEAKVRKRVAIHAALIAGRVEWIAMYCHLLHACGVT